MIDANAPVAIANGTNTGDNGLETNSKAGDTFLQFLQDHQMALPSTFKHCHHGSSVTWAHATGKQSRKDYVAIRTAMMPLVRSSWVDTNHDNTFSHDDHRPVVLQCGGWMPVSPKSHIYRWDEEKLLSPECCQAFQKALMTLPVPQWSVSIDDHAALHESQILHLGQQFFAPSQTKSHRIVLTPKTLSLIALKRQALDYGRNSGDIYHPPFKAELRLLEKDVHKHVRADIQSYYDILLERLDKAGELHNHRLMYKILNRLGRKKAGCRKGPRPLPMLQKSDGTCAESYRDQQTIWMRQFGDLEAGTQCPWEVLGQDRQNRLDSLNVKATDVEPSVFPTVWQTQALIAGLKRDKVPGPNCIPPALLKAGGEAMARHLTVLFTKAAAHASEPLLWKGGQLIPLWKGKESPHLPSAYRSIFVSNYSAKLYHQFVRRHLVAIWEQKADMLQCGGRKTIGADTAHHLLQCQQSWAAAQAIPSAILYIDLRAAFYTVIRQAFTNLPNQNQAFLQAMTTLGVPMEDLAALLKAAEEHCVTEGLSDHMQKILHDMMVDTFFTIPGLDEPCCTTRGTRPGDPVADVLFNMCMTHLLSQFRTDANSLCDVPWLGANELVADFSAAPPLPREGYLDVTFVDDCALLVHAATNQRVGEIIRALVVSFDGAAKAKGLQVNFDKGKTELLWNVIGRGSKAQKQQLYEQKNKLRWEHHGRAYEVNVCHSYKHLGTWVQTKHRHAKELLARASAAKQQWGQLARPFFRRQLSLATRVRVFQALVVSKMIYNVHTWAGATSDELDRWTNHLRGPVALLIKGVIAKQRKFRHPTDTLCAWCGILPLQQQVHMNRLRFAKRLFQRCPAITWQFMCADPTNRSWLASFRASCTWMRTHYDKPHLLPTSDATLDWIHFISLDVQWKGKIRKTGHLALQYHMAQAEHAIWQHNFEATLVQAGATLPEEPASTILPEQWQCDLCNKIFASTRALAMHASREHGYRKKVRYYASGDTCPVCCQLFHARSRLAVHLEHNPKCYEIVQACWPPLPEEEVAQLDHDDKTAEADLRKEGWWATKAFAPAIRTEGPPLPPLNHPACLEMYQKMHTRRPPNATAYSQLQGHRVESARTAPSGLWWQEQDLPAFVLQSVQGVDPGAGAFATSGLAREAARLHIRALVIVHFFSGFRRDHDIHQIIEQRSMAAGSQIFVISVDLCMQRHHADLATHRSLQWWKQRAHSGQLVSVGGGPPCETFTAARQHDGLGPRPVRSAEEPHGMKGLTWKEWQQVQIGDRLLRFLLEMLLLMAILGYTVASLSTHNIPHGNDLEVSRAYGASEPSDC